MKWRFLRTVGLSARRFTLQLGPNKLCDVCDVAIAMQNQLPPCQSDTESAEIGRYIKSTVNAVRKWRYNQ